MRFPALRSRLLVSATIVVSGCIPFGKCLYEIRSIEASGVVTDTSGQLAQADIDVFEQRDTDPSKSIHWLVVGTPAINGHVVSAAFKDSSDPTRVLLTLPLSSGSSSTISESATSDRAGTNLNGFFELVSAGRGIIEIQTDLPDHPVVTVPLRVTQKQDWIRPECS